ncbi:MULTISPECIES: PP2C family protein-serine/threonine phosphatase [Streptomyces]|uniref:PP2C family protein-serine/threonine phosphatase n=2 Tax=Streptomyces TaxID=1883 RepID=A0ABU4KE88_9ACTN|nr:PP2C family protein-serine/threonine phosphatase [Streptomyces roseolus]MDX2296088.1 PP2C family protein-serine/threonine phosphatase [Streptomyces roseolus]
MHAAGPRPRPRPAAAKRTQFNLGRALPVLVMAVVVVVDLVTPDSERVDRLLFTVPALAAATWSVYGTIGIGVVAMALRALLVVGRGEPAAEELLASEGLILSITAASAWVSAVRSRYVRDLAEVTAVADVVQRVVLRPLPPRLGPVDLHLLYVAAAAKARIGGDFYEAVQIPGAVRIMLGDVQGKGLGAVETASVLLGAFRSTAYDAPDLPALADRLDEGLARYAAWDPDSDAAERFATVVLVELPDGGDTGRLLNCGHPAPLLQHGSRIATIEVAEPSLPLNLAGLADSRHHVEEFPFGPGDRLLLYTDGVSETRDRDGVFYPLEERARLWSDAPSDRIPELLHQDLAAYGADGLDDDVAALVIARTGGAAAPAAGPR